MYDGFFSVSLKAEASTNVPEVARVDTRHSGAVGRAFMRARI